MSAFAPLLGPKLTSSERIINPSYERAPLYRQSATRRSRDIKRRVADGTPCSRSIFPTNINDDKEDTSDRLTGSSHRFKLLPALRVAAPTDHGPLPAGKPLSQIVNARRESLIVFRGAIARPLRIL
jgi:hypothetical protein